MSGKYSQRLLDHAKQSATNALETSSKIVIQDTTEPTGDLSGNKIANKIRKVSKNSQQNNLEIVINDNDKEMPKERYMSPEKRQDIIDDLNISIIMEYQKIINLLENTPNQPSKFTTNYWVEVNDESGDPDNVNSQIKFKTSMLRWHYYKDEPFLNANGAIADFPADNNNSALLKFKTKIAGRTGNDGTENVKMRVPLKYLGKFWRTLEMSLISCEINLVLTWPNRCFIIDKPIVGQEQIFTITDTKLCDPFVTLATQDNVKLLEQLKPDLKKTINWNKHEPRVTVQDRNQHLDLLINRSFQGVNRLFVLSFQNNSYRTSYTRY